MKNEPFGNYGKDGTIAQRYETASRVEVDEEEEEIDSKIYIQSNTL